MFLPTAATRLNKTQALVVLLLPLLPSWDYVLVNIIGLLVKALTMSLLFIISGEAGSPFPILECYLKVTMTSCELSKYPNASKRFKCIICRTKKIAVFLYVWYSLITSVTINLQNNYCLGFVVS